MSSLNRMFGKAVRRLRLEAGYSQESFADAIGVHRNYIGTVERGETNITLEYIGRIARGLKQAIWSLLRELESPLAAAPTDIVAIPQREAGAGPAPPYAPSVRVAERRAQVREQLVGLLEELTELERTNSPEPSSPRSRKNKK